MIFISIFLSNFDFLFFLNLKIVANAYEILKDEEARNDYDYMLDNPDAYYAHYYRYYRRKGTKVDVRIVLFVTISIISIIQHFNSKQKYETAIKYFMTVPKYRNKALEMAAQEKAKIVSKKGKNKLSKAEQKEEMDKLIRKVIEENMDIQGAYAKPDIFDILWIQILICPYTLAKYLKWYFSWIYNFTILKKEYGDEEKLYLIRKMMKMGKNQFNAIEEDLKQEYLELELWEKENYEEWKLEEEEQKKIDMAGNSRHKQYRRYMKNHGPGRMTFED